MSKDFHDLNNCKTCENCNKNFNPSQLQLFMVARKIEDSMYELDENAKLSLLLGIVADRIRKKDRNSRIELIESLKCSVELI